jgi:hypothetical protein
MSAAMARLRAASLRTKVLAVLIVGALAVGGVALRASSDHRVRASADTSTTTSTTAPTVPATSAAVTEPPPDTAAAPDPVPAAEGDAGTPAAPTDPAPAAPPPPAVAPAPTGFPSAATTGPYSALAPSGATTITDDGAVIEGLDISGCVTIDAANVTIRNSRIRCSGSYIVQNLDKPGAVLDHVDLDGGGSASTIATVGSNLTINAANIHGVGDGPRAGSNSTISNSYIHDLIEGGGSHNDGIQSTAGSNITITGNNIQNPHRQTSAILIGADLGDISGVYIAGNLLNGGSFTVYAGNDPGHACTNVSVVNNAFGRDFLYGTSSTNVPVSWSGNYFADDGAPVNLA